MRWLAQIIKLYVTGRIEVHVSFFQHTFHYFKSKCHHNFKLTGFGGWNGWQNVSWNKSGRLFACLSDMVSEKMNTFSKLIILRKYTLFQDGMPQQCKIMDKTSLGPRVYWTTCLGPRVPDYVHVYRGDSSSFCIFWDFTKSWWKKIFVPFIFFRWDRILLTPNFSLLTYRKECVEQAGEAFVRVEGNIGGGGDLLEPFEKGLSMWHESLQDVIKALIIRRNGLQRQQTSRQLGPLQLHGVCKVEITGMKCVREREIKLIRNFIAKKSWQRKLMPKVGCM